MSEITPSSRIPLKERWLNVAFAGALGGVTAALLDGKLAVRELGFGGDLALLLLQAVGRCGLAGVVLGVLASLAVSAGERLSVKRPRWAGALGVTLFTAPGCLFVAKRLFEGGYTSRLPARSLLMVAVVVFLLGVVLIATRITLGLAARCDRSTLRISPLGGVVSLVLLAIAYAAHFVDGYFYRRLYLYLHSVLGVLTLACLIAAFRLTIARLGRPASGRGRWAVVGAVAGIFVLAHFSLNLRQTVKIAAFENTATTANLLQAFSRSTSAARRGEPSKEILAIREERERKARIAASGDFPVFPGAHILMVTVDALRADRMGIYGNTDRDLTPNIDAWVEKRGLVFDRAYCTAPHSSYSISSLHTSRFIHDDVMLKKKLDFPTIADVLVENGYQTIGFYTNGIFFTEGDKVEHYRKSEFGIQKVYHGAPPPDEVTDRAIAEIDRAVLKGEPPTFLWVHYFNVHEPYTSTRFGTAPSDKYDGEIAIVDPEVARLIGHAEEVLKKGAVIVFAADHGEEFKDHGGDYHGSTLYDEQVRVPLIFGVPGGEAGRVTAPVSTSGVAPTVLKLVGIAPAATMVGQDLRPAIFKGEAAHVAQPVFAAVVNQHMVLRWPWKLIYDPASLRYELYNLESDSKESFNRYDENPALAKDLTGEILGWLDELGKGKSEYSTALNRGYMRDPRAVSGLVALLGDVNAPTPEREEAAQLLGNLRDYSAVATLKAALDDENDTIAIHAALALGAMGDLSGEALLRDALFSDSPELRDQAAFILGRAGDTIATPFLIEALGRDDYKMRDQATKALGVLRDPAAVDALLDALKQYRLRYLTVLTLGKIGDLRAYDALMDRLENDDHTDVRGHCVIAFGWMEATAAVPRLIRLLREEPEIKWTPETLVRLGAPGAPPLFGTDVAKGLPALKSGWGRCVEKEKVIDSQNYLGRTSCETTGGRAELSFPADIPDDSIIILRARNLQSQEMLKTPLEIFVDGRKAHEIEITPNFAEYRLPTPKGTFKPGRQHRMTFKLNNNGKFEVDHALVLTAETED